MMSVLPVPAGQLRRWPGRPCQPARPRGPGRARWPRRPRATLQRRLTVRYTGLLLTIVGGLLGLLYLLVVSWVLPLTFHPYPRSAGPGPSGAAALEARLAEQRAAAVHELLAESVLAAAAISALAIAAGWVVTTWALGPLRGSLAAVGRLSAGPLPRRFAMAGPDGEVRDLHAALDVMLAGTAEASEAGRRAVGQVCGELRHRVARQRALFETALADPRPSAASLEAVCERALDAATAQEQLIEAAPALAWDRPAELINLAVITGDVLARVQGRAQRRGFALNVVLRRAPALAHPELAERLAACLVENALRGNVPGGWVEVITGTRNDRAILSVCHTGPVISPAGLDQLFGSVEGAGLRLAVIKTIAGAHHAQLKARGLPGGGLEVQVCFPPPRPAPAGSRYGRLTGSIRGGAAGHDHG
jgi:signal transduction histidine kinase